MGETYDKIYDKMCDKMVISDTIIPYNADGTIRKPDRINRLSDLLIKSFWATPGREHILLAFINALLSDFAMYDSVVTADGKTLPSPQFVSASITNPEITSSQQDRKSSRLDVLAVMDDGTKVNIEVQVQNEEGLFNRFEYYSAGVMRMELKQGDSYADIMPLIHIIITSANLFKNRDEFVTRTLRMVPGTNIMEGDAVVRYYLELSKLKLSDYRQLRRSEAWALYLSCIDKNAPWKELEAVDSVFKDVRNIEERFFGSKENYLAYLQEEKARMAAQNQLYTARKEGIEEGIEKGIEKGREEGKKTTIAKTVSTMMANGFSLEEIVAVTGFSREEVEEAATAATEATAATTEEKC